MTEPFQLKEAPRNEQQATNAFAPRAAASGSTASRKGSAQILSGLRPKPLRKFLSSEQDKRGYAPRVELGLAVAKQGVSMNQHFVLQGMRDAFTELSIQAKNTEAILQGTAAKPQGSF